VKLILNGQEQEFPKQISVAELVAEQGLAPDARGVAIAVDAEVLPRSAWGSTRLREGQKVELVAAIQGG
jgi:sulfur carrier protein